MVRKPKKETKTQPEPIIIEQKEREIDRMFSMVKSLGYNCIIEDNILMILVDNADQVAEVWEWAVNNIKDCSFGVRKK